MLMRLVGQGTNAALLKEGLDVASARSRAIANRVANATTPGAGFAEALEQANAEGGKVDLEAEMVALADEQIRYEATSRLLAKVYASLRASVRERS